MSKIKITNSIKVLCTCTAAKYIFFGGSLSRIVWHLTQKKAMTSGQNARVSAAVAYLEATGLPIRVICDLVASYDTNELQCVFAFQDKGNAVPHYGTCVLCALPDGRLASGSRRGAVRVCDISTGQTLLEMIGHSDDVWCLAALAGGKLASGSADCTVQIGRAHV